MAPAWVRAGWFAAALAAGPLVWLWLGLAQGWGAPAGWLEAPLRLAWLALVLPVLEELGFRGGLQPLLASRLGRRWGPVTAANLATSALFAAAHLWAHPPLWALATLPPSLIFGYARERSGGVAAPAALHVFYNAGYFLLLVPAPVPGHA